MTGVGRAATGSVPAARVARLDTVLFDATGTLIAVRGGVGELYAEVGAAHGLQLEPDLVQRAFEGALAAAPPLAFPGTAGKERAAAERAWWREVARRTVREAGWQAGAAASQVAAGLGGPLLPPARFEAFFDDLYRTFAGPEAWRLEEGAREILAGLAARGYLLGVLSNFDSRLPGLLAGLGLEQYLAATASSSSLGAAKPDPRAFRRALALLRRDPDAAAYVGDSPETDAAGAARAGLLPVLLRAPFPSGVTGFRLERLADLLDLLPRRAR